MLPAAGDDVGQHAHAPGLLQSISGREPEVLVDLAPDLVGIEMHGVDRWSKSFGESGFPGARESADEDFHFRSEGGGGVEPPELVPGATGAIRSPRPVALKMILPDVDEINFFSVFEPNALTFFPYRNKIYNLTSFFNVSHNPTLADLPRCVAYNRFLRIMLL